MADFTNIGYIVDGTVTNVDIQNNSLVVGSLKVGSVSPAELTKEMVQAARTRVYPIALAANVLSPTALPALTLAMASYSGAKIEYTITEAVSGKRRVGTIEYTNDGVAATYTDSYTETALMGQGITGLDLSVAINGSNLEVRYNNSDASNTATMEALVTKFVA